VRIPPALPHAPMITVKIPDGLLWSIAGGLAFPVSIPVAVVVVTSNGVPWSTPLNAIATAALEESVPPRPDRVTDVSTDAPMIFQKTPRSVSRVSSPCKSAIFSQPSPAETAIVKSVLSLSPVE